MKCIDFVFYQSSGQLTDRDRPLGLKQRAMFHVWTCRACRKFKRNDELLGQFVQRYREQIKA